MQTAAAPLLRVQATQASASAPVEVSWVDPPSGGAANITGYRIFYGSGENISVPSIITHAGISLTGNQVGQTVSIRVESAELLHSELLNVTIITSEHHTLCMATYRVNVMGCSLIILQHLLATMRES